MNTKIADTALVDPRAQLGENVEVGPFCVIGPNVKIGRGTHLCEHVLLAGTTTLGEYNTVGPFSAIGGEAQDISPRKSETRVEIGDHNIFNERVTIHRATEKEFGVTRLGSRNHIMANCHVAHDCQLGDDITMGTGTLLAGHVRIESFATILDATAILQFVTLGGHCHVGVKSKVSQDVPCFMLVNGNPAEVRCVNAAGLKHNGLSNETIVALQEAYRLIYRAKIGIDKAHSILEAHNRLTPEVQLLLAFIQRQHSGKGGKARP